MAFGGGPKPYSPTGTTSPYFVPGSTDPQLVQPGEYFRIRVHSAQAAFRGRLFEQAKQLVITSQVNLHHAALGNENVFAIQRTRAVKKNHREQLGLSPNLVSLVPATMSRVFVSLDFVLDTKNTLAQMGSLINSDAFLAAVSLAPGAAAVAKTIGSLGQQVIQTFVPATEQKPILEFTGDFNIGGTLATDALRDGYYVILGSKDAADPLPVAPPQLQLQENTLLSDGGPVDRWSYVIFQVTRLPVRTREMNEGALWDTKLYEAERIVKDVMQAPYVDDTAKREAWSKCLALLLEARALLMADANYAPSEADAIYRTVYKSCSESLTGRAIAMAAEDIDTEADRMLLGIAPETDLAELAARYSSQVEETRRILEREGG